MILPPSQTAQTMFDMIEYVVHQGNASLSVLSAPRHREKYDSSAPTDTRGPRIRRQVRGRAHRPPILRERDNRMEQLSGGTIPSRRTSRYSPMRGDQVQFSVEEHGMAVSSGQSVAAQFELTPILDAILHYTRRQRDGRSFGTLRVGAIRHVRTRVFRVHD